MRQVTVPVFPLVIENLLVASDAVLRDVKEV